MTTVKNIYSFLLMVIALWGGQSVVFGKDVKITVEAPRTIWENEQFNLVYIIESDEEIDNLPRIEKSEGFDILHGPRISRSFSRSVQKGKPQITYSLKMIYVLKGKEKGKYTLPLIEVVYDGKKQHSKNRSIEIKSLSDKTQDQVAFVKTIVSKTNVRPTDTLTITYRLYTTMDVDRIIAFDLPRMPGFYVNDMTRRRQYIEQEEIDGKKYKVIDLRKLLLQPRKEGTMEIPEGEIEIEFSIPTGGKVQDIWGDVYDETINKIATFTLDPATIKVYDYMEI